MPTYDYTCAKCGWEDEYRNVPSNQHPVCAGCGQVEGMRRLQHGVNISVPKTRPQKEGQLETRIHLFKLNPEKRITIDGVPGIIEVGNAEYKGTISIKVDPKA